MNIVFLDRSTLGEVDLSGFERFGNVRFYETTSKDERFERVKNCEVIVVNKVPIDLVLIRSSDKLKLVLASATGVNNIDLEACKAHNIAVANVAGYSTASVVAHTFALYFYLAHHMPYYANFGQKEWADAPIFTELSQSFSELEGKKWGVIGMGTIGQKVASVATAFGAEVGYFSTSGSNSNQPYKQMSLLDLMGWADVVSIHAPLNKNTLDLIGKKELDLMKNGSIILNLGRGGIINESDLATVLESGKIKAGLDVLSNEPPKHDNPLLKSQNIVITPHIAWGSVEARKRLVEEMILNLEAFLDGKMRNRVI